MLSVPGNDIKTLQLDSFENQKAVIDFCFNNYYLKNIICLSLNNLERKSDADNLERTCFGSFLNFDDF